MLLIKQSALAFCGDLSQLLVQSGFGWCWITAETGLVRRLTLHALRLACQGPIDSDETSYDRRSNYWDFLSPRWLLESWRSFCEQGGLFSSEKSQRILPKNHLPNLVFQKHPKKLWWTFKTVCLRSFDPRITTPCYGSSISSSTRPSTGPSSIRPSATGTGAMRPVNRHAGGGHQAHGLAERLGRDLRDLHRPGGWVVWLVGRPNNHPALRLERDQKPDWLQVLWSKAGHLRDSEGAMTLRYCQMLLKMVFEDINMTLILSSFCLNRPLTTYLDPLLLVNPF